MSENKIIFNTGWIKIKYTYRRQKAKWKLITCEKHEREYLVMDDNGVKLKYCGNFDCKQFDCIHRVCECVREIFDGELFIANLDEEKGCFEYQRGGFDHHEFLKGEK